MRLINSEHDTTDTLLTKKKNFSKSLNSLNTSFFYSPLNYLKKEYASADCRAFSCVTSQDSSCK